MPPGATPDRAALEAEWLCLTRETLPALAASRRWPVRADHCFQRILLDAAVGGVWYDAIAGRPAYRFAPLPLLETAVALGRQAVAGTMDMVASNRRSLAWRRARKADASTAGLTGVGPAQPVRDVGRRDRT